MQQFVLDTSIFIEAHRTSYPLDVATGFWNMIKRLAEAEKIISIDKVKEEINKNDDELNEWIGINLPDIFFQSTNSQNILNEYSLMAPWAESRSNHYQRGAINEFLDYENADAWLIAYCKAKGDILVTHEVSNPRQKNRIPIPEPCKYFGVSCYNLIDMLRSLGVQF